MANEFLPNADVIAEKLTAADEMDYYKAKDGAIARLSRTLAGEKPAQIPVICDQYAQDEGLQSSVGITLAMIVDLVLLDNE